MVMIGGTIMKISAIIPVYNGEKTIERCIKSILAQSLEDFEIIIVNDGSTDGTLDKINGFTDSRITVISQENQGQGFARNTGMTHAIGEYISFVDADDTIDSRMYSEMYELAKQHDAEIVQCNICDIFPDGTKKTQIEPLDDFVEISDNAEYISKYLAPCLHSYEVCNKLFKRDFILKHNLKFEDTRKYFSEDILFNLEAVKYLRRICFFAAPHYNYYQHSKSHMHNNANERIVKMTRLFQDYLAVVDGKMKISASYLAAMVMIYNIGECDDREFASAAVKDINPFIKTGLRARCSFKHRLFLIAAACVPASLKVVLAQFYSKHLSGQE
jgi:glycosyltransferase involved in cell wall biosynthesis